MLFCILQWQGGLKSPATACLRILLEVLNTRFENLDILLSVDIDSNACVTTLTVCHLSEDTSIRACDTLDVHIRAVYVKLTLISGLIYRTYSVAICPFSLSFFSHSSFATKRPSP